MCTPDNMGIEFGNSNVMSPNAMAKYKEAVPEAFPITIPKPPSEPIVKRDDTYVPPKGATIKMPDGRMVTKESYEKLQAKLKQRKG